MSVSILEALMNAQHNLGVTALPFQRAIGLDQLNNAIGLLEKGYSIHTEVEPLLDKYGSIDGVPDIS